MKEDIALKTGLTSLGVVVVHYVENLKKQGR